MRAGTVGKKRDIKDIAEYRLYINTFHVHYFLCFECIPGSI